MSTDVPGKLTVSSGPLQTAFKKLSRLLPAKSLRTTELVLSFSGSDLLIESPGATVDVPATGVWPRRVRLPASFIRLLANAPPAGDPLTLEFSDGKLALRGATTTRFKAVWEDISPSRIDAPLDLSDRELLKIAAREAPPAILSSGLKRAAENAELRFQRSIGLAYKVLSAYGVKRLDFERAVRELIVSPL